MRRHRTLAGRLRKRVIRFCVPLVAALFLGSHFVFLGAHFASAAEYPFSFSDAGQSASIFPHVEGIRGQGAAWGDVDGDGWPDLFVASFHNSGSKPGMLLRNLRGTFRLDPQPALRTSGMGSGALFVDLTNSGRLDLYVSTCAVEHSDPVRRIPSRLFRNDGAGRFTDVSQASGACPNGYAGRGLTALDFDGDGLLDLLTCEQYYSPDVRIGPALYRNLGDYRFESVSQSAGLPVGAGGLGVAAADLNGDSWPDIVLTHGGGENRILLNDGTGRFTEAPGSREVLRWKVSHSEDTPAGVAVADVNRDTLPDIVIGHHFSSPWNAPEPVRLYLNRGVERAVPRFQDVTQEAGLMPLGMKAPHVEIQDFDNDGWPDILVSIVKFDGNGRPCPVIFRNLGTRGGMPRFRDDGWAVNDFPTAEDCGIGQSGPFFDKVLRDKKIIYMAAGPSADFDRDGRLDLFLASWWIDARSLLLRNETQGGNWLEVCLEGRDGINRMGIGARVQVYAQGQLGEPSGLVGSREISAGYGYCSGQEAVAHFGLGDEVAVDVEIILPNGRGQVTKTGVHANQRLVVTP